MIDFTRSISSVLQQLKDIPDAVQWPVSERMTAFFFMLLDELDQLQSESTTPAPSSLEFAERFNEEAAGFGSPFHSALQDALISVARAPDVSSINRVVTDSAPARFVAAEILIQLLQTSLRDTTPDRQRSAALADKALAYAASIWATPVPEKAVDLFRYTIEAGYIPLQRIPIIGEWFGAPNSADSSAGSAESAAHEMPTDESPLEDANL